MYFIFLLLTLHGGERQHVLYLYKSPKFAMLLLLPLTITLSLVNPLYTPTHHVYAQGSNFLISVIAAFFDICVQRAYKHT